MKTKTWSTGRRTARPRGQGGRPGGFTIVEMTVVVIIVAVLAGMIVPRLGGSVASSQLREAARGLLAAAKYARDFAVTHRCCCRLVFHAADRRFALQYQPDPEHRPGEYEAMSGAVARFAVLPEQVRVAGMRIEPRPGVDDGSFESLRGERSGEAASCITFRPTGESDAAVVELTDGRQTYCLLVFPHTGRVALVEGAVGEMPTDREDLDA